MYRYWPIETTSLATHAIHTNHERLVMKKTDWPIRWDLLLRYRLIEIIAYGKDGSPPTTSATVSA